MNYSRFLNAVSLARRPSMIRLLSAIQLQSPPTMISMASGMPNGEMFPFKEASFSLGNGKTVQIDSASMKRGLQYSATQGLTDLIAWVNLLQKDVHNPPLLEAGPDNPGRTEIVITNGSQDGLCKALESMITKGDNILLETPLYPGTLAAARPLGPNILGVRTDKDGLDPAHLAEILSRWSPDDARKDNSDIPRVLYCVPNGGNPTGHGLTRERKESIYSLAQKYDLIILEDDPYFYLQFSKPYVPSFLSIDTDGRVLRFDSFSKLLSSGMRVGFVSGPKEIVDRIVLHMQASVLHCSSLSQILLLRLLEQWGLEGFRDHVSQVSDFYRQRRDECLQAAENHLTGLAEWSVPSGGMFLWLKLTGITDTYKLIMEKAREKEVLFVPGSAFQPDDSQPSSYMRAAYSLSSPDQMQQGFSRLAALIREEVNQSR